MTSSPCTSTPDPSTAPTVAVCIASYQRPDGLRALLESLDRQIGLDDHAVRVVVVDNDPAGSAAAVLGWADEHTDLDIRSDIEPRPGVSHARNRSFALAGEAAFIAVIDDDMTAEPDWLSSLLAAQGRFDADVVGGRVERSVVDPGRQWVTDLSLFAPLVGDDEGATAHAIELGNSLIRRSVLGAEPFDPSLGVIGGEDTKLFLTLSHTGHRIVTTTTARAHEVITSDRSRLAWMTGRSFRLGSSWSMIERSVLGTSRTTRATRGAARIVRGAATVALGVITLRRRRLVDGLLDACQGAGMIAGLVGVTVAEYGRRGRRLVRVDRSSLAG